jgi:serine/threonine-protein kinase RsbW
MPISFTLDKNIPADLKKINPLIKSIAKKVMILTKSEDESFKIKLALEEALTNAIRHGNKFNPRLKIRVRIKLSSKKALFDICDQGQGFDYRKLPDPTAKDRLYKPSGRGVYLMRKLMDKVEFYQRGQGVRMEKCFSGQ